MSGSFGSVIDAVFVAFVRTSVSSVKSWWEDGERLLSGVPALTPLSTFLTSLSAAVRRSDCVAMGMASFSGNQERVSMMRSPRVLGMYTL